MAVWIRLTWKAGRRNGGRRAMRPGVRDASGSGGPVRSSRRPGGSGWRPGTRQGWRVSMRPARRLMRGRQRRRLMRGHQRRRRLTRGRRCRGVRGRQGCRLSQRCRRRSRPRQWLPMRGRPRWPPARRGRRCRRVRGRRLGQRHRKHRHQRQLICGWQRRCHLAKRRWPRRGQRWLQSRRRPRRRLRTRGRKWRRSMIGRRFRRRARGRRWPVHDHARWRRAVGERLWQRMRDRRCRRHTAASRLQLRLPVPRHPVQPLTDGHRSRIRGNGGRPAAGDSRHRPHAAGRSRCRLHAGRNRSLNPVRGHRRY